MKFNKAQVALIVAGVAIGISATIMRKTNYIDSKSEYAVAFLVYEHLSLMLVGIAFVIGKRTIERITGVFLMLFSTGWIVFLVRLYYFTKP